MAFFQTPFGQKRGNSSTEMTSEELTNFTNLNEDYGTGGIRWITERHVACVFLLDTSGSMRDNDAIGKLNAGIRAFKEQTISNLTFDEHTKACIDVALVSFGPDVKVHQDFIPVSDMVPPVLTAGGKTPMGAAVEKALDMIAVQKEKYNDLGTPYFRPWIFCITDGVPTDSVTKATKRLKEAEDNARVLGYCVGVGVGNYDRSVIESMFNKNRIFELDNLNFPALFEFVSNSLGVVRNSDSSSTGLVEVKAPSDLHSVFVEF